MRLWKWYWQPSLACFCFCRQPCECCWNSDFKRTLSIARKHLYRFVLIGLCECAYLLHICMCLCLLISASDASTSLGWGSAFGSSMELLKSYLGTHLRISTWKENLIWKWISSAIHLSLPFQWSSEYFRYSLLGISISTKTSWILGLVQGVSLISLKNRT